MRYISNYCKQELENQRIVRLAADDRLAKNVVRRQKLRMQFKEAKEAKQAREMYEAAMTAAVFGFLVRQIHSDTVHVVFPHMIQL